MSPLQVGCSKSRKISERFLTKWHGDIATRGASRTFGEGLGRSTVAHFARKVRGSEYCGGQARAKNPTKICPRALAIFATCSWPSLCKQSELQCWRRNRRLCGPAQISAARTLVPISTVLSQIAWRLRRCKGHRANIRQRSEAKHCSSLCSQSEGDEYCGGQTRLKIQQSHALKRWPYSLRVRGPHFASKVSYSAGASTDDYAGLRGLKAQQVRSPGQRPGYHVPIPYAL